jgi:hypothetical protein
LWRTSRLTKPRNSSTPPSEVSPGTSQGPSISIDGHQICTGALPNQTCSQSQLSLTFAAIIGQLLGAGSAALFPLIPSRAAEWVATVSYLLMTFSTAMALALSALASTLSLLHRSVLDGSGDLNSGDNYGLYVVMVICSMLMWLSFWAFHSWVNPHRRVQDGTET